jgi:hypothetical protein
MAAICMKIKSCIKYFNAITIVFFYFPLLPKRRRLASLRLGKGKQPGRVYRPRVPGEGAGPYPGGPQHRQRLNPQKHGDRTG